MTQKDISAIIEWLYVNDGGYKNKIDWRMSFIQMLKGLEAAGHPIVPIQDWRPENSETGTYLK